MIVVFFICFAAGGSILDSNVLVGFGAEIRSIMISGVIGMVCLFIVLKIDVQPRFEMFVSVLVFINFPFAVNYLFMMVE